MPILRRDIFEDCVAKVPSQHVNPYVGLLAKNNEDKTLPIFYGPALEMQSGQWKKQFQQLDPRVDEVVLEIGCHNGEVLRKLATFNPRHAFVGMDITFKRVITSAKKIQTQSLQNASVVLGDARYISRIFAPQELSGIVAFFPDPWIKKKKQAHNRLFTEDYCREFFSLLKDGGFIWIKSDSELYFTEMAQAFAAAQFTPHQATPLAPATYESVYELKFKAQNAPIYEGVWIR